MRFEEWIDTAEGKVLITGACSGIGLEYLKRIVKTGTGIIAVSENQERMDSVIKSYPNADITPIVCDFRKIPEVKKLCKKLEKEEICVLINNAGIGAKGLFTQNDPQTYIDTILINNLAPTVILRSVLPKIQEKNHGLIINISSINSLVPIPKNQTYTATKAFLSSLALAISYENKDSDVLFQLVLPGTTDTPFHVKQGASPSTMFLKPSAVVEQSLDEVDKEIIIPLFADRILSKFIHFIPSKIAMGLAQFLLEKRLGV